LADPGASLGDVDVPAGDAFCVAGASVSKSSRHKLELIGKLALRGKVLPTCLQNSGPVQRFHRLVNIGASPSPGAVL
jgi:hypothetical protein